jgi:hypothetical protein
MGLTSRNGRHVYADSMMYQHSRDLPSAHPCSSDMRETYLMELAPPSCTCTSMVLGAVMGMADDDEERAEEEVVAEVEGVVANLAYSYGNSNTLHAQVYSLQQVGR